MEQDTLKRIYREHAPQLDPEGFQLYRAAEALTGFDLYGTFPYEDNRGLFEEMDGHQLLRWLVAGHFRAVDWTIIPGTCCEAATLREVDTTTPEYQVFERQIYEKTLEKLGVDTLLPRDQTMNRPKKRRDRKKDERQQGR